jgi:carboxylesterase type B
MFWLHGGNNEVGSGAQSMFNGVSLTTRGVVLVTTNYRLGALGFFSHSELSAKSPYHSSGNYGLLDQIAALRWVYDNIAQFGGDPQNVTLFGESAGAIDSTMLMTSPLAEGLFRRVISESGPAFDPPQTLSHAEAMGKAVGELAPGEANRTPLERLRALPASEVERLVEAFKVHFAESFTLDGRVLSQSPRNAFLNGSFQKVDLLIGLNGREYSGFRLMEAATPKSSGNKKGEDDSPSLKDFFDAAHPCWGTWSKPVIAFHIGDMLVRRAAGVDKALDDVGFACPIGAVAALTSDAGQRVYVYRFDRSVPAGEKESWAPFTLLKFLLCSARCATQTGVGCHLRRKMRRFPT